MSSFDRAATLQRNTLASLAANDVECSTRVDSFVANAQEADCYSRTLTPGSMVHCCATWHQLRSSKAVPFRPWPLSRYLEGG